MDGVNHGLNKVSVVFERNLISQAAAIENFAEALGRFSPKIMLWKRQAIVMDVAYSNGLEQRIKFLAKRLGWAVSVGRGRYVAYAVAAAFYPRFNITQNLKDLPIEALTLFLNPLDTEARAQASQHLMKFQVLGLKTVADFAKLPLKNLGSRFGRKVAEWAQVVRGELEHPWRGFRPPEKVLEKISFDPEIEIWALEPLLFSLRGAIDRLLSRLHGRGERLSKILVELELVNWSTVHATSRKWEIFFPLAQGSSVGVLPILRDVLKTGMEREGLAAPVSAVTVKVLETLPGRAAQKNLFDKTEEAKEAEEILMARLISQLGAENVFQVFPKESYLPEKTWEPALERGVGPEWDFSRFKNRPTRILEEPLPAFWNDFQGELRTQDRTWKIQDVEGPERIDENWWEEEHGQNKTRSYYRVFTEGGEQLWIFFRETSGVFIHGFFD